LFDLLFLLELALYLLLVLFWDLFDRLFLVDEEFCVGVFSELFNCEFLKVVFLSPFVFFPVLASRFFHLFLF